MIASLITPKIGLGLIKHEIEKQTDKKVKNFHIIYHSNYDNMKLKIEPEGGEVFKAVLPDESGKLQAVIKTMINNQLHEKIDLDAFQISYENKEIFALIFYTINKGKRNEEKIKQKIVL